MGRKKRNKGQRNLRGLQPTSPRQTLSQCSTDPDLLHATLCWWNCSQGKRLWTVCLLLGRSRWEKEVSRWFSTRRPSIWSTVFKGQIRSSFQACPRPILQIARACIRVFPFRFPPPIPQLLLMERAFQQQEKPTRSAPGEPVRLTIHKVLPSAQSKPTEGIEQLYLSVFLSNLWGYT